MESVNWFGSAIIPWIGMLSIGVFVLIMAAYFSSAARPLLKRVPITCPESGNPLKVLMRINIFREAQKVGKGLDVVSCPRFSREEITCSKGCVFDGRAQQTHRTAGERHIEKNTLVVS